MTLTRERRVRPTRGRTGGSSGKASLFTIFHFKVNIIFPSENWRMAGLLKAWVADPLGCSVYSETAFS